MNKNEKFVVTINREVGTGGRTVGRKLAEKLGVKYYDKAIINGLTQKRRRRNRGGTISTTIIIRWSTVQLSPWRLR